MADVRLRGVSNPFLKNVNLDIHHGELFVIVGPSGAGKTSLLNVIAGLAAHQGSILIDGREMRGVRPRYRRVGLVTQDLHLFPHLTLEGNILLAMQQQKLSRSEKRKRAEELMQQLRISHLSSRRPSAVSGGEKQRGALARVLASSPRVLLLDEPFSKLDFRTSRYLRSEVKRLQRSLALTTIVVTHNLEEATEMGDSMAVMQYGAITQTGTPTQLRFDENHNESFLERSNVLHCTEVKALDIGLLLVKWAGFAIVLPDEGTSCSCVTISSNDIEIGIEPPPGPRINRITGSVRDVQVDEETARIVVDVNGQELRVEMPVAKWADLELSRGDRVHGLLRLRALAPC